MWPSQIEWPLRGMSSPHPKKAWGGDPLQRGSPHPVYFGGGIYTSSEEGEETEQGGDVPVIGTHSHHYGIQ